MIRTGVGDAAVAKQRADSQYDWIAEQDHKQYAAAVLPETAGEVTAIYLKSAARVG